MVTGTTLVKSASTSPEGAARGRRRGIRRPRALSWDARATLCSILRLGPARPLLPPHHEDTSTQGG